MIVKYWEVDLNRKRASQAFEAISLDITLPIFGNRHIVPGRS
uniref:Uncharacterized protein n=1 Tax=Romanomermis culicivorax TaxID=13658 RepID=A0A915IUD1_ROMCU